MKRKAPAALLLTLTICAFGSVAWAQNTLPMPGGGASAEAPGLFSGIMRYIMAMQQEYYRSMAGALRAVDLQGSAAAAWTLASLSFLYGIFHAAGPGHGKIVVASYILADEREVRRGIMVAFLSAFAQAITAITAVGLLSLALGLTHRTTASAIPHIERASFVLIAALGAWLIWRAVRGGHEHEHSHEHDHDHAHMPTPAELRKAKGFREMAAMVLSVGLRPCSGAVLVLLFAVTQGAFLIGAASALVMSLGTAITVSVLAILTVFSKNAALRLARRMDSPWAARIEPILMAGGGAIILVFGVLLFASTFAGPSSPLL
ncbi:MAG: nickel transporter [Alphaproteobacteria bacterium HGW-Alphaproteobacteria-3]|jgi:ABC-type nickel/cobalt efflux system permease component RcnA|nr:MAG: nickel transporter [Alphaproteobacteria bacterium HGW-Alphaproteobacteria-3]